MSRSADGAEWGFFYLVLQGETQMAGVQSGLMVVGG